MPIILVLMLMLVALAGVGAYAFFDHTPDQGIVIQNHHFAPVAHWIPEAVTAGVLTVLLLAALVYATVRIRALRVENRMLRSENIRLAESIRTAAPAPVTLRGERSAPATPAPAAPAAMSPAVSAPPAQPSRWSRTAPAAPAATGETPEVRR